MTTAATHENKLCQVSHRCHLTNFRCPLCRICVFQVVLKRFLINCTVEKGMADTTVDATRRLNVKKQTLDDAYAAPANFLEIDVINPITHGVGKKRYTDYEVRMRVSDRLLLFYFIQFHSLSVSEPDRTFFPLFHFPL